MLLEHIELTALIEQHAPTVRFQKAQGLGAKRTQKGPCPFCQQGRDRFAVFILEQPQHYYCGIHGTGCGAHGDAIDFLMEYAHLSYQQACRELDLDEQAYRHRKRRESPVPEMPGVSHPPGKSWQERAEIIVTLAERYLWREHGEQALTYLYQRGLTERTIRSARLGYIPFKQTPQGPVWYREPVERWGIERRERDERPSVYLPEGVLLPWYAGGHLWKLNIRRLSGLRPGEKKYREIRGSACTLYGLDLLHPGVPATLVEGEFDALIGTQETGLPFLATGSTSRAKMTSLLTALSVASQVLIAFDADANEAGNAGAAYWVEGLPHGVRWLPWHHDVNEMYQAGDDLSAWLECGLILAEIQTGEQNQEPIPPVTDLPKPEQADMEARIAAFTSRPCAACGGYDYMLGDDGLLVCPCILEKRARAAGATMEVKVRLR